jgi:hypothetical protein
MCGVIRTLSAGLPRWSGVLLVPLLAATGCATKDDEPSLSLSDNQATELRAICEEHDGGVKARRIVGAGDAAVACDLMVGLMGGFGTNCPDFATLRASWELYLTEGGEYYGDCTNVP